MSEVSDPELVFIQRKGGTVLIGNDGHQYFKLKCYKNGSAIWRCSLYAKSKCSGSMTMKEGVVLKKQPHVCKPDFAKNKIAICLSNLQTKVTKCEKPIPRLYEKAVIQMEKEHGKNVAIAMPPLSSVQHSLYDMRNKSANVNKTVFVNFDEVQVPEKYYDFILADYYSEGVRIMLFCSPDAKKQISEISECFGDATFKACPKPFLELYTIIGDVGSTPDKTKVVPLIFALLSDKKQSTYTLMFDLIKSQIPEFKPKTFHCDFEIAAINAVSVAFPEIHIIGCYYHWHRCLWKKAKEFGNDKCKAERRIVALCAALPLLPQDMILDGLSYIKEESEHLNLIKFQNYIKRTWIRDKYLSILSVYGMRHRTNNVLESYHSKLNKYINKNNVTLMRLLNVLKNVCNKSLIYNSSKNNKRQNKDIINDDNIRHILLDLISGKITVGYALEKLR